MQRKRHYNLKYTIRPTVQMILENDAKSRSDDQYLFTEVVRVLAPQLLYVPMVIAFNDERMPSTESVRRTRQWLQSRYDELKPTDNVQAGRELMEETYKEFATHG